MRTGEEVGDRGCRGSWEMLVRDGGKDQAMVVSREALIKPFLEFGDGGGAW